MAMSSIQPLNVLLGEPSRITIGSPVAKMLAQSPARNGPLVTPGSRRTRPGHRPSKYST
jgi:hypothetical protein